MLRAGPTVAPPVWTEANVAQLVEQRRQSPCHPGLRLSCGPGWRQFASTAGSNLVSLGGDRKVLCHPDIPLVCGQEANRGPCHTDIAVSCGQGWSDVPCVKGSAQVRGRGSQLLPSSAGPVDAQAVLSDTRALPTVLLLAEKVGHQRGPELCEASVPGAQTLKGLALVLCLLPL